VTVIATRSLLDVFQLFYCSFRWTRTPYVTVLSLFGSFTSAEAPSVILKSNIAFAVRCAGFPAGQIATVKRKLSWLSSHQQI
jgi:hypothetical protein